MSKLPTPSLPDLLRAEGDTAEELANWLKENHFEKKKAPFNYITGIRSIKHAYKGFHKLAGLLAACDREKVPQSIISNREIVALAAPLAFGRTISVFDLRGKKFRFGRDLLSSYRVPFFFVERGIIKLFYVQPRKGAGLSIHNLAGLATIYKKYLIDIEFYGQPAGIEFVDLAADLFTNERVVAVYDLDSLPLWTEDQLTDRISLLGEALEICKTLPMRIPERYRAPKSTEDMPPVLAETRGSTIEVRENILIEIHSITLGAAIKSISTGFLRRSGTLIPSTNAYIT